MAGNFRIDVVVSGGAATGTGTALPSSSAAASGAATLGPLLAGGAANVNAFGKDLTRQFTTAATVNGVPMSSTSYNPRSGDLKFSTEEQIPFGLKTSVSEFNLNDAKIIRKGGIFRHPIYGIEGKQTNSTYENFPMELGGEGPVSSETVLQVQAKATGFNPAVAANQARLKALGSATLAKAVYSAVQYTQHTSGDSYYNQQLSNTMKLGGYALLLANSGPAAPFVAAGIVVTEGIQAVLDYSKFQFDRRLEKAEITNNMIAAGNASYGRMRGVGV